jgi:hypothetical protein
MISEPDYMVGDRMNKLLVYLLMLLFTFHLPSSILYSYPEGWSDDILLTPEDGIMRMDPDIDVDGSNNIWVTWDSSSWWRGEVLYSKRDSLGNCSIPETSVSNNASKSWLPRIVVDSLNNVHFVWRDESPHGDGLWHAKFAHDGTVIVPSHLAVSGAGGMSSSLLPEIALDKYQNVNVIWDEHPSGYNQMNYTKLDSVGDSIIAKIRVSLQGIDALWPGIGVDSMANNHLGYRTDTTTMADRLTYSKLDKDGNILISNKFLGLGLLPTIISDRTQNIHMVYLKHTSSRNDICYLKLDNNGNILVPSKQLSLTQHIHNNNPHMAMDSLQYLHVVWETEISGTFPIMYAKLDTLGDFVIPPMQVVYPPYTPGGGLARIAVDRSNRLHLVWVDGRLNPGVSTDIFYKRGENETSVKETKKLNLPTLPKISVFPNPFNQITEIRYQIPDLMQSAKPVELKIYDAAGRLVRIFPIHLCNSIKSVVSVCWNGTDDLGNYLPAGVYFLRIASATASESIPVVLLK